MSNALEGLKPELVWKYFAEISAIPRCSGDETAAARYVMETARALGLEVEQDETGNVVVRMAATGGREGAPSVCLQGHLDMVCEANRDKAHDFSRDPITLLREGDCLTADGTTLGADNGIAVAAGLALMEDRSVPHGPLEFLFTVSEETGLNGAKGLQPGFIRSRLLLNLDSEEEGALYVGCAGGMDTVGTWKLERRDVEKRSSPVQLTVRGLRGGHSGLDIEKGRGNAVKILNRLVMALSPVGARVASMNGGSKRNAIPREADALLFVPAAGIERAGTIVAGLTNAVKAEFASAEPDLEIEMTRPDGQKKARVLRKRTQESICRAIAALPHGVMKMSPDIPGLVETSTNVASIVMDKKRAVVATSQRSSVASEIDEICDMVVAVFGMAGASIYQGDGYPGWKPNLESPLLSVARSTYRARFGKDPEIKAIHAGLECGIIGERYPGIDMLSFGPTLENPHSPDERIYIDTVTGFWELLLGILKNVD